MRSYARRSQGHRGKISIHAHDDAAHADRLSETRIEVHASRRPKITTGCYGFAPQASVRSTRFSCVSCAVVDRAVPCSMLVMCGEAAFILHRHTARADSP